jgi:hypothetical protein
VFRTEGLGSRVFHLEVLFIRRANHHLVLLLVGADLIHLLGVWQVSHAPLRFRV